MNTRSLADQLVAPLLLLAFAIGCVVSLWDDEWPLAIAVGAAAAAGMYAGRRNRVVVAVGIALVTMVFAVVVGEDLAMLPLVSYACFYLGYGEPLRTSLAVGVSIAVALGFLVPVLDRERLDPLTLVGVVSLVLVPLLLGIVVRQQQQQVQAQVEAATASLLEQERRAIARDLHDIVAHGLTAVAIQSGTAVHLFDSKPDRAKEALVNVNAAARSALTELRAMVGELRSSDEARPAGAADPIAAAIERVATSLEVTVGGDALPPATPSTVRVALERVTGEALANVMAHGGGGPASVNLIVTERSLQLTVDNDQGSMPPAGASSGFGIVGMTERVVVLGGTLVAEPRPAGFTVTATIPRGDW